MRVLVGGFLLSLILFTAALLNCSLISLGNLVASLLILFVHLERGFHSKGRTLLWFIVGFSVAVILLQATFIFAWAIWCGRCTAKEPLWAKLIGFMILQTWRSPTVIYVLILQSLAAFIAFTELQEIREGFFTWASSFLGRLAEAFDRIGRFTGEGCFFLAVACHSVGCGYQLHVLGFFTVFHFQLCGSCGLVIIEQLSWPLQVVETSLALRGLQYFLSICLSAPDKITKVSLFALSLWSFYFASVCAFGLLGYVGYIIFAFPSLFRLHRLNGLLLVFILLWAVSTYIFNIAFTYLNGKLGKDTKVWEMVGLWHYSFPGFFILAQFFLGVLVALVNLVNNSVFLYISDESHHTSNGDPPPEAKEETKVLIVATIAWILRKCNRAIMLLQIFLIAMKPGFIHAVYMIFFFLYLLSHHINKRMQRALLLLCEIHFAILYTLHINLVSGALKKSNTISSEILSQLGLLETDSSWNFAEIALLA
ncbi:piezo-type mechanosensitive ion channel, partial [Tanacetum coccineum]